LQQLAAALGENEHDSHGRCLLGAAAVVKKAYELAAKIEAGSGGV
jgi:hypothetical protein